MASLTLTIVEFCIYLVLLPTVILLRRRLPTLNLRRLATGLAAIVAVFIWGSFQRAVLIAANMGLLSEATGNLALTWGQLISWVTAWPALIFLAARVIGPLSHVQQSELIVASLSARVTRLIAAHSLVLTPREAEIVEALSRGRFSDSELAAMLSITPATAATHVRNILKKSGLTNRRDLIGLLLGQA